MFISNWDLVIFAATLIIVLYYYGIWFNGYFKRRGVKNIDPGFPILGTMWNIAKQKKHVTDLFKNIYDTFPEEKYVGNFEFTNPMILLRDLDLIKQVALKDFDHFMDHRKFVDEKADPLFGRTLFSLRGSEWKDMRSTLSPAFTSAKMKNMFIFINKCAKQMVKHYENKISDKECIEIELRDAFSRYTNDVIATSAFGVSVNSLDDENNEFYLMGKRATTFNMDKIFKILGYRMMPRLFKLLKVSITESSVMEFFRELVQGTIKMREKTGVIRPDMIHLLMESKKGLLKHETGDNETLETGFAAVKESLLGKQSIKTNWSDDDITAQALIFFLAGFDSSSTLLCLLTYELALNSDIQKKLQKEIDELRAKTDDLTYFDFQNLKYLDMVVSETLRLWPPTVVTDRVCVKPYTLPPPNDTSDKNFKMEVGRALLIPIHCIHRDPKYYPDPEKFDPERFSDENKSSIPTYAYLPFGLGPRNCIGSRFALMEVKAVIFHMLANFDIVKIPKTQVPIEFDVRAVTLVPKDGYWVGIKKRKSFA